MHNRTTDGLRKTDRQMWRCLNVEIQDCVELRVGPFSLCRDVFVISII